MNFKSAILTLKKLPKLTSVYIDLNTESQVEFLIRNLLNLKRLNNETVNRDEIL